MGLNSCSENPQENPTGDSTFKLIIERVDNGSAKATPDKADVGVEITLTAIPNPNWFFTGWDVIEGGVSLPSQSTVTFVMPAANVRVKPVFSNVSPYSITIDENMKNGTIDVRPGTNVAVGNMVIITAKPADQYRFDGWTDETKALPGFAPNTSDVNKASFSMPAENVVVSALFRVDGYTITVADGIENGTVTADKAIVKTPGEKVTITAAPAFGYALDSWSDETKALPDFAVDPVLENKAAFSMPEDDVVINATFAVTKAPYILYRNVSGRLEVGAWGNVTWANMMYFKFGSVIGFTNGGTGAVPHTWVAANVKYNPTDLTMAAYADIPFPATTETTDGYYASDTYNTFANLQAGLGDPCRLVGKTANEIKAMTEADYLAYKSGYQLMNNAEASRLTGTTGNTFTIRANHIFDSPTETPVKGAVLPYFTGTEFDYSKFLPAAGYYSSGTFNFSALAATTPYALYWTGTGATSNRGSALAAIYYNGDNAGTVALQPRTASMGNPVRCMPVPTE
jgi:hypothetical protein